MVPLEATNGSRMQRRGSFFRSLGSPICRVGVRMQTRVWEITEPLQKLRGAAQGVRDGLMEQVEDD